MNPFHITCVTCRARLTVRDESAIGQILACPRCGSMVQVAAPADARREPTLAQNVAATEITSTPHDVAATKPGRNNAPLADAPPVPPSVAVDRPADHATFDDAVDALDDASAPAARATPPTTETASWGAGKFAALIAASAVVGSALVATTLHWLGGREGNVATVGASPVAAPNDARPDLLSPATGATDDPAIDSAAVPDDAVAVAPSDPGAAAPAPSEEPAPAEALDRPPVNQTTPADADVATSSPPLKALPTDAASNAATPDAAPPAEEPVPRMRIDPLDVDPEGLNLSSLFRAPVRDPLAASEVANAAPPAESAVAAPPPHPLDDPAPPADDRRMRRDADSGSAAAAADPAPLLARRLAEVRIDKMPLARLLDFASQLSGLPVSVAPEQLRLAAVSAATTASVDAKDATIESLLAAALKPLRLQPAIDGAHIVLLRAGDDKRRDISYQVDDLATSDEQVEQLAAWIQQLAAPATWQSAGGDGSLAIDGETLQVEQLESVQYEILLLLERYRLVRGLPIRSKYPAALLTPGAAAVELAERLSPPATFTFSQYTPLGDVFRYWQQQLGVAVLVDWPALAQERLWPQSRIATSSPGKPWAEALDEVLSPLGLAWRAIDASTIEITSLEKASTQPQLELYRLAPEADVAAEGLAAKITTLAANGRDAALPAAIVANGYDAANRILLVRAPATVQRQLAQWLAEQSLLAER